MTDPVGSSRRWTVYWQRTCIITGVAVSLWLLLTLGLVQGAVLLAQRRLIEWPVAFFVAAQGVPFLFVLLAACYTWAMRRLERMTAPHEPEE